MKTNSIIKAILIASIINLISIASYSQTDEFTDTEGTKYKTMKIGDKIWMAENLKSKTDRNGNQLSEVYTYSNEEKNVNKHGRLYRMDAAIKACPEGWHIPTIEEWEELISHIERNKSVFHIESSGMYDFTYVYQWLNEKAVFITAKQGTGPIKCYMIEKTTKEFKLGTFHPKDAVSVRYVKN